MDGGGGKNENGKVHVGNNGLSWDVCSVGNWGTIPSSSTSSPPPFSSTRLHNHQMAPPFPTTHIGFRGGDGAHGTDAHHHLTCLKLGKRQYYEEAHDGAKKERGLLVGSSSSSSSSSSAPSTSSVPRCQVEGCNVALVDAKDYHKRHKVCEQHSKAPDVIVHGLHQRFCQQCSRFHVTSEFDDTKRSCRRRLAGHNERRRKSSNDSIVRHPLHDNAFVGSSRFGRIPPSITCPGRALSLLSAEGSPWVSPEISHSSSAALRELIAENRAALLGRPYIASIDDHTYGPAFPPHLPPQHHLPLGAPAIVADSWHRHFHEANPHVTLDLMQVPAGSSMELTAERSRSKEEEEEECCEIWKSLEETHVV